MNIDLIVKQVFNEKNVPTNIQNEIINLYNLFAKNINDTNPRNFKPTFSNKSLKQISNNKELRKKYKLKIKILTIFGTTYIYDLSNKLIDKIENYYDYDYNDPTTNATTGTFSDSGEAQTFLVISGLGLISYGVVSGLIPLILFGIAIIILAGLLALIQASSSPRAKGKVIQTAAKQAALTVNIVNDFSNNIIDELIIDDNGNSGVTNNIGHIVIDSSVTKYKYNIFDLLIKNSTIKRPGCENINCNYMIDNTRVFANNPCCINPYSRYQPLPEIKPPVETVESTQDCRTYCDGNNRVIECKDRNTGEVIHRQYFQDESGCCEVRCNPNTNTWIKTCGNVNPSRTDTNVSCTQQYKL
jgi:hypothetical protein